MSLGKMGLIKRIVHRDGSGLKVVPYGKSWFKGFLAILLETLPILQSLYEKRALIGWAENYHTDECPWRNLQRRWTLWAIAFIAPLPIDKKHYSDGKKFTVIENWS
jgi:hypothetical protein